MEIVKIIATVCGAVTSVAAAIAVIAKVVKWFAALKKQIDSIELHEGENYASILRIIIMSPDMPLSERLIAGDKYIKIGGNGEVKAKYNMLKNQYEECEKNEGYAS